MTENLSLKQKQQFKDDGFIVIKNAVPTELIDCAKEKILAALPDSDRRLLAPAALATHPDIIDLFYASCLDPLLRNLMGPFPPLISCQVAMTPAFDQLGGEPGTHVDGAWSGDIPSSASEVDLKLGRPKNAAAYFGENDDKRGTNDGQLWIDPARRISTGSYTVLVGICLNDQSVPGNGQFAVLKGLHEEVEATFIKQHEAGSIIGPEGLGWPRMKISKRGMPYMNGLPDAIRARKADLAVNNKTIEGWPWPELTPVLMKPGDAVLALHSCPHTATPNLGPNARINVYFRIRRLREENPHEGSRRVAHGVSDHPDRGYFGQFLEYPDCYDPWQTSIDKLCDHWSEWDGMQAITKKRSQAD
jgi:hypothetical protein